MRTVMVDKKDPEPTYQAPTGGAYPVEEHLRAQVEQKRGPNLDQPVHPDATGDSGDAGTKHAAKTGE